MKSDYRKYIESWSRELDSRADRVRNLIGDAHWLSDGHHKEAIIRELVLRYVTPNLSVGHGFIKTSTAVSKEQDILIFDSLENPPYFNEGGLQIIDASSVVATIEVKSAFDSTILRKALDNVATCKATSKGFQQVFWTSICFATPERNAESIAKTVHEQVKECLRRSGGDSLPNLIGSFSNFTCLISTGDETRLRVFDTKKMSFAILLTDMMQFIRHRYAKFDQSAWAQIIEDIGMEFDLVLNTVVEP